MPRFTIISKYCTSRCSGVFASWNVGTRLLPWSGICWMPLTKSGSDPGCVEDRGGDIDQVTELCPHLSATAESVGPVHDRLLAGATAMRSDLLGPLVRSVHRPGPPDGEV